MPSDYKIVLNYARAMRKEPTPAEKVFWSKVRGRQILKKKFYRQYIFQHAEILGKKRYYIADFFCNEAALIVEIDGAIHHQQVEYDKIRTETLIQMGYRLIRFTNTQVLHNWPTVAEKLFEALNPNKLN